MHANIDWPTRPGLSTAEQQAELLGILDRAVELRLNAVILLRSVPPPMRSTPRRMSPGPNT